MDYSNLVSKAFEGRKNAYAPYSNFKVGAAVLTEDGKIYTGCNIENASYGATNCAERTAIFKAISEGHKTIEAIAIVGVINDYTYPCGICRQVISEFASDNTKIILGKGKNEYIVKTLDEILPGAFTKKDLEK
ncbi:cytidine deaminase [Clostridium tyrobutyricum]|jgi:cytidine deaminase, homotetrameric|uniref:Cytidine deaminase n=1 Tax=Clostridium tyrobutyricum DIVETGP TaxID=1408889 RepID=W6N7N1_CLOTY|nr:cytidine deaminase [Clostridium tyrobutyricum]AND83872.1 cytidine deaminase [Clostridium tyrobutyricum]ANP68621.1 cytidine deaminase [Clostridium tyrobutyricum]MBR9648544.1 cytidine deaminase [Clostridium tyrobutyricum]MBV4415395.1 cytidine deaminase [Clostridium tyrobutyricum]MBV4417749.1 cytidine deaminase [Clostridium tyrobutyricum]